MKNFLNQKRGGKELYNQMYRLDRKLTNIYENFEYSFEQFEDLAAKCDNIRARTNRKAIIIIKGEVCDCWTNSKSVNYGNNIKSFDYTIYEIR